jgi:beta-lactamase regulating signal transducer with metallopeptidase domain
VNDILMQLDARGFVAIALKATLLLCAGWVGARLLRRASAVTRHAVWLGVIVGAVAVPLLARLGPIELPVLTPAPVLAAATSVPGDVANAVALRNSAATDALTAIGASAEPSRWTPRLIVFTIWSAVSVLILAWFGAGMIAVRGIVRRSRAASRWNDTLARAADRVGTAPLPRIVVSDEVDVAFACNALTPTIVLPASAEEWTDELRYAVLAHELAHIKRRDLFSQSAANIACAMYWFNPLVWRAARRLREESELACDAAVLESGVRPADYAQQLLSLVTTLRRGAPMAALAVARPGEFEGRLVAILDRARFHATPGKMRLRAMLGGVGALAVSVSAIVPVPRSLQPGRPGAVADPRPTAHTTPAVESKTHGGQPPQLSDAAISVLLHGGASAVANPMQTILRFADSLALNGLQADSIATLNRSYRIALDRIWRPVLRYYATHAVEDEAAGDDPLGGAQVASIDELARLAPSVTGVLSAEQRVKLPPDAARWIDSHELSLLRRRAAREPDVVFEIPHRAGARVGEGSVTTRPTRPRAT